MEEREVLEMWTDVDLIEALRTQIEYWYSLPGGVDEDADPDNPSPEDATAHIGGLAIRAARRAISEAKETNGNGSFRDDRLGSN